MCERRSCGVKLNHAHCKVCGKAFAPEDDLDTRCLHCKWRGWVKKEDYPGFQAKQKKLKELDKEEF